MQTVLVLTSNVAGMICINGRMAGEVDADNALSLPVAAYGAVIVEHRPFGGAFLPLCLRLTLSGGEPVPLSIAGQKGVAAAVWPGGVIELELRPEPLRCREQSKSDYDLTVRLRPEQCELSCLGGGREIVCGVPEDASLPEIIHVRGVIALLGACRAGRYVCVVDEKCERVIFTDSGRDVHIQQDGLMRLARVLDDLPGHAQAETWILGETMRDPVSVERLWAEGAPVAPRTPAQTALAAVRSVQAGDMEEAVRFFTPASLCREALSRAAGYDGCVLMKYPAPDGRPCVGLVRALGENMVRVVPAAYGAAEDGVHGWRLESLDVPDTGHENGASDTNM